MRRLALLLTILALAGGWPQLAAAQIRLNPMPWVNAPFANAQGTGIVALGSVYTYEAGTTTNKVTYADSGAVTANTNPVSLGASGRAKIYFQASCYHIIVKTNGGVTVWDEDNLCSPDASQSGGGGGDGVLCEDMVGSNAGKKINAAIAELPSTGGIVNCLALNGGQAVTDDLVFKDGVTLLLGAATYTFSGSARILPANGTQIIGLSGASQNEPATTVIVHNSANYLITVGATAALQGVVLRDLEIETTSTSVNAGVIKAGDSSLAYSDNNDLIDWDIENVYGHSAVAYLTTGTIGVDISQFARSRTKHFVVQGYWENIRMTGGTEYHMTDTTSNGCIICVNFKANTGVNLWNTVDKLKIGGPSVGTAGTGIIIETTGNVFKDILIEPSVPVIGAAIHLKSSAYGCAASNGFYDIIIAASSTITSTIRFDAECGNNYFYRSRFDPEANNLYVPVVSAAVTNPNVFHDSDPEIQLGLRTPFANSYACDDSFLLSAAARKIMGCGLAVSTVTATSGVLGSLQITGALTGDIIGTSANGIIIGTETQTSRTKIMKGVLSLERNASDGAGANNILGQLDFQNSAGFSAYNVPRATVTAYTDSTGENGTLAFMTATTTGSFPLINVIVRSNGVLTISTFSTATTTITTLTTSNAISNTAITFATSAGLTLTTLATTGLMVSSGGASSVTITLSQIQRGSTTVFQFGNTSTLFIGKFAAPGLTAASGTPNTLCQNAVTFEITVNATTSCVVSARDQKTGIAPLPDIQFNQLIARQFRYIDRPDRIRFGFIADEMQAVDHALGDAYNQADEARSIDTTAILALTVKKVQELEAKIAILERAR